MTFDEPKEKRPLENAPCGICHQPSGKTAQHDPYMSGDRVVDAYQEVLCDACQRKVNVDLADYADLARITREYGIKE